MPVTTPAGAARLPGSWPARLLERILPRQADNGFRGHWLAIWLLVPILIVRLVIGANSILNTRYVATSADGIPLASFDPAGANAVVGLFALLGLARLIIALQGVVVLVRYRAFIPAFYLLLLIQQAAGWAIGQVHPIVSTGAAGAQTASLVILTLQGATVIGFAASLVNAPRKGART